MCAPGEHHEARELGDGQGRGAGPRLAGGGRQVAKKQSCYLPFTRDSVPCMGRAPRYANAYVATGHGCWGILLSLASGRAMAELILDGEATCCDLQPFDPGRF